MKRLPLYTLAGLLVVAQFSCSKKQRAVGYEPGKGTQDVDPTEMKPEVDTRFQEKFFAAQLEKSKDNLEKAYALFEECLQLQPNSAPVHFELGRMDLQMRNNPQAALLHAKAAVEVDKTNAWYHLLVGNAYMELNQFDLAIKSYREVEKLNPDDPNVLYQQATAQLRSEKYQDAIATFDRLEQKFGAFEDFAMQKHQLWLQLDQPEKAGLELEKLARAFPEEPRYWGLAAQYYSQAGMKEKAKMAIEEMVKSDPENGQVHFQLSEYYAASGDDARSYEELEKAFHTVDIGIDQKIGVLVKYLSLTDFNPVYLPQAYKLLELTEQLHPGEAKAWSIYGDFLYRDDRHEEAIAKFRKAAELDPSRNLIWEQIISLDNELRDYDSMVKESSKAIELFPMMPEFYYYNAIAHIQRKDYSKAVESLLTGKELVVENDVLLARFLGSLGEAYHYLDQHEKSDEVFEKSLKVHPDNVFVLNNYAYYLSLRKTKLDRAAEMASQATLLAPGQASFEDTYAWILFQQGKYLDALVWIEKAMSHTEENGELLEHYGDILFMLNRPSEALEQWKAAKELGGTSNKIDLKISEQKFID